MKQLENIASYFLNNQAHKLTAGDIARTLSICDEGRYKFKQDITSLVRAGFLIESKKKRLSLNRAKKWIIGHFLGHKDGYGFVTSENHPPVYIPSHAVHGALHQDIVLIEEVKDGAPSNEGKVIFVLKNSNEFILGTFKECNDDGDGFVIPLDNAYEDIFIPYINRNKEVIDYDYVRCEIVERKKRGKCAVGRIIEIVQVEEITDMHLEQIIEDRGIPSNFSKKTLKEMAALTSPIKSKSSSRLDLTEEIIFTIDGVDAKDLDDAVSIKYLENGFYELGVHIADVTHYVKEGTGVDKDAYERGTSVYFPNKVIPMLPTKLSNDLCSLHPNSLKFTLSVIMEIDKTGEVRSYRIAETMINSIYRFNYDDVTQYLNGTLDKLVDIEKLVNPSCETKRLLEEKIQLLDELAAILKHKRMKRGAITFHRKEVKVETDEQGVILINKRTGDRGHRLIEEAMLVCNETVAKHFSKAQIPFVYRVHQAPQIEKIKGFQSFIKKYGYEHTFSEKLTSLEFQQYLESIENLPEYMTFQFYLLRCMMQARYEAICEGHFGLSAPYYAHFTSPIRRYPDLMIHRIIKASLNNQLHQGLKNEWEKKVDEVSKHCSKRERIAEQAEKDFVQLQTLKWGEQNKDEVFEGYISDIQKNSLIVSLDNTIELSIRYKTLAEQPLFNVETMQIQIGENRYKLGDKVFVQLKAIDWSNQELLAILIGAI